MTTARLLLPALLLVSAPLLPQKTKTLVADAPQQGGYNNLRGVTPEERTSIIRILANPDTFDAKRVEIQGFFHFEFEESAIYFHQVDSDQGLSQNAIWVNLPNDMSRQLADKLNNHYVHCEGRFSSKDHGHMGAYSGELSDLHLLNIALSKADIEKITRSEK